MQLVNIRLNVMLRKSFLHYFTPVLHIFGTTEPGASPIIKRRGTASTASSDKNRGIDMKLVLRCKNLMHIICWQTMRKRILSPVMSSITMPLILFFASTTYVNAGAALSNFSRNYNRVSLSVIAWSEAKGVANPCFGWSSCYVGPDVRYSRFGIGGLYGSCIESGACVRAEDLPTLADVAKRYKQKHPLPFNVSFNIDHLEDTASCIGMAYINYPSLSAIGKLVPGSACVVIPPDHKYCEINIPAYIEHGTLSASVINGNTASVAGSFTCNYKGRAKIFTVADGGTNHVRLNVSNLISEVKINEHDATQGVVLKVSANQLTPLNVTSTLKSSGSIPPGNYSGSVIVYINYY